MRRLPGGEYPLNITSYRPFLDQHLLDLGGEWMLRLRRLADLGWVLFEYTDTAVLESGEAANPDTASDLTARVRGPVAMGAVLPGHSLPALSVATSSVDADRITALYVLVWPTTNLATDLRSAADGNRAAKTRVRDVKHLDTTIRYGGDCFVTLDRKLLSRSNAVRTVHNVAILSPRACAVQVATRAAKTRFRYERYGRDLAALPSWPTAADLAVWETQAEDRLGNVLSP